MRNRWIAILLAAVLCVLLPLPSFGAASLAEGEHVLWIDRLAADPELPAQVAGLYAWMEAEGEKGADGALADPAKATYFEEYGFYGYELAVLQNEEPVRFTAASERGKNQQAAWDAIQDYLATSGMQEKIQYIIDYSLAVTHAFNRDHPEFFWVTGGTGVILPISYTYDSQGEAYFTQRVMLCFFKASENIDIRPGEYRDPAKIREDIGALNEAVEEILKDLPDGSRRQQLSYLNRWLTTHNSYREGPSDSSARNPLTALTGSVDKEGPVCEGYARAMKILCDRVGIPCVLVNGNAYYEKDGTPVPHMWNSVQMEDGCWYALDVTWNDPVGWDENNQRVSGAVSGFEGEKYFLSGSDTVTEELRFADSHAVINDVTETGLHFVNGPALAKDAYTETAVRVETEGKTVLCGDFAQAIQAADGKTAVLTLVRNVSAVPALSPSDGSDWTLDLNGFTLRGETAENAYLFTAKKGITLTIRDSSADKTGRMYTNGKVFSAAGGTIRLEIKKSFIKS